MLNITSEPSLTPPGSTASARSDPVASMARTMVFKSEIVPSARRTDSSPDDTDLSD